MTTVKIAKLGSGSEVKEYILSIENPTVEEALSETNVSYEGYTVSLNGDPVDLDELVSDGDIITLTKEVKGN